VPRQGRDTYFEPVPISVTLVVSSLGRQAFYSFLNNIDGGASSFIMPHDTGLGIEDHQVLITSDISDSTDDGKNWVITFTATAERTAIQEDTCLTKNLPDLYGCYGDCLGSFLKIYANYETTFPRIWSDEGPAGYPPINLLASALDSRIVYDGPQVYYINRNGNLVQSATNEWPLTFIDGVAVGRVPPEGGSINYQIGGLGTGRVLCSTTTIATGDGSALSSIAVASIPSMTSTRLTSYASDGASSFSVASAQVEKKPFATSPIITDSSAVGRQAASAKVAMNGATSIDITYSDSSVVNVQAVDGYATIPQADSAWGSKYITRIDFNVDG
jgi:hypothetical protein